MRLSAIILFFICGSYVNVSAQITGKALNLPGIWKYDGGSGFEIWEMVGEELVGSGYRTSKLNDTVKVEDLRISKTILKSIFFPAFQQRQLFLLLTFFIIIYLV